jgi:exodeoxyribonuclease VII large subunit
MAAPVAQTSQPPKIYRLSKVTARIREIILEVTGTQFWVQAHLVVSKGGPKAGHFYCELVELDAAGRQVARMRAVAWRSQYEVICRKLKQAGLTNVLGDNQEICALCSVSFHEVHGLSLQIHDVDPNFGEAQIDRNRRLILAGLKQDGLLERNKQIGLPAAALRIGLVTAASSAAYNDFHKTLANAPFAFRVILASAAMQGERTAEQVSEAVKQLVELQVDVICIVRGGGSQLDLAWFDNDAVAREIALCPIPVWVGIGHEIDRGVLDVVAHGSFKTPTAVAEELVRRISELDDRLTVAQDRLQELTRRQLDLARISLERSIGGLLQGTRKHFAWRQSELQQQMLRAKGRFESQCAKKAGRLDRTGAVVRERVQVRLSERVERLGNAEKALKQSAASRLEQARQLLSRNLQGLRHGSRKHLESGAAQLQLRTSKLRAGVERATSRRADALQRKTLLIQTKIQATIGERSKAIEIAGGRVIKAAQRRLLAARQLLSRRWLQFARSRYDKRLEVAEQSLAGRRLRLESLSLERMLRRGYSVTRDAAGRVVRSASQVAAGERILTELADGSIQSIVTQEEEKPHGQ